MRGARSAPCLLEIRLILRDSPTQASWLKPIEKQWLIDELEADRARYGATQHHSFSDAFRLPILWMLIDGWLSWIYVIWGSVSVVAGLSDPAGPHWSSAVRSITINPLPCMALRQ